MRNPNFSLKVILALTDIKFASQTKKGIIIIIIIINGTEKENVIIDIVHQIS